MPDMHLGKGACVGCVVATVDAIIPAAVGVVSINFNNFDNDILVSVRFLSGLSGY